MLHDALTKSAEALQVIEEPDYLRNWILRFQSQRRAVHVAKFGAGQNLLLGQTIKEERSSQHRDRRACIAGQSDFRGIDDEVEFATNLRHTARREIHNQTVVENNSRVKTLADQIYLRCSGV